MKKDILIQGGNGDALGAVYITAHAERNTWDVKAYHEVPGAPAIVYESNEITSDAMVIKKALEAEKLLTEYLKSVAYSLPDKTFLGKLQAMGYRSNE